MYNDHQKRIRLAKRIVIITLSVAAVVALGLSTAMLLRSLTGTPKSDTTEVGSVSSQSTTAPSAESVISGFTEPTTIKTLNDHYVLQEGGTQPIFYKAEDKSYETNIVSEQVALYSAKSRYNHDDSKEVAQRTAAYLEGLGYSKQSPSKDHPSVTTFTNDGAVCQLVAEPKASPALYSLSCADKSTVASAYSLVDSLIAMYQKNSPLISFTKAYTTNAKEGTKAMSIITLIGKNEQSRLLFASVSGKWEYLGSLSGNTNASNGKYSITPAIESAINNPKYGDFLTRQLK